jgi:hypothetical protein
MVAHQSVVLQSWVRFKHLPSQQLTASCLVDCHLEWHLVASLPLWGEYYEKWTAGCQKDLKKEKKYLCHNVSIVSLYYKKFIFTCPCCTVATFVQFGNPIFLYRYVRVWYPWFSVIIGFEPIIKSRIIKLIKETLSRDFSPLLLLSSNICTMPKSIAENWSWL